VLTAPSGAGKSTIARRILRALPSTSFSVSATTRPPRPNEVDGVNYHFLTDEEFDRCIREGHFVEYEEVYPGIRYGTLVSEVAAASNEHPKVLDIDVRGAWRVKQLFDGEALTIFIEPPSFEELAARLTGRATETPEAVVTRLERARSEMSWAARFDHIVVNDDLEEAADQALGLVQAFLAGPVPG
jgi:guanylate kinase